MNSTPPPERAPRAIEQHVPHDKTLIDYARLLYKRRRIAIPVFLVMFIISGVNAVRQTPVYEAKAQLLIETDTPSVAKLDQMFEPGGGGGDDFLQTQFRLLQSRSLARQAIDGMKLWDAPKLGNGPEPRASISVTPYFWMAVHAATNLVVRPTPAHSPAAPSDSDAEAQRDESAAQSSRIDQFLGGLSIAPVRNSRIVEVHYQSTDPVFAAAAANAMANAYIQQNTELRFNSSKDATDWLSDRLAEQRSALQTSEAALQAYREEHGTMPAVESGSSIVVQRLIELNGAVTKARTERINKEALYKQLQVAEKNGTLDSYPAVLSSEYVQKIKQEITDLERQQAQLAQRYGDRHPEMIKVQSAIATDEARLKNELGKVVDSVRSEYATAVSGEQSLQAALDAQRNDALALNRQGIELGVLERDVESNKQIYETLMQRTKETGISGELRATNVRIVDVAEVPRGPISPNVRRDLMFSFASCLLLAVVLAFVLEQIDNRIRTPLEMKAYLGLAFLGMVPTSSSKGSMNPLSDADLPQGFLEAHKTVRTNVLFSSSEEGLRSLVITSAGPGEGKSVVAANLAIALAQTGLRVLLVDADMRRPRVHEIFGVPQEPGLSNVLTRNAEFVNAVRRSSLDGLSLLSAGQAPPNPAELLASGRFQDLLASIERQGFNYAIIDSPPVLAVTDAMIVGNKASGVVFVVRSDKTARQAARTAVEQLDSAGAHIVGAVLNHVNVGRHPYYYTGHYRKEYSRYYVKSA